MKPHEFKEILDRYSRGESTPEEEKLVDDWYANIGKGINVESFSPPENKALAEMNLWLKIRPELAVKKAGTFYFIRAAAAVLLLAVAGSGAYYFFRSEVSSQQIFSQNNTEDFGAALTSIVNENDKHVQQILLDDGSEVTLKPHSEIRFAKKFLSVQREVYLTGEAFFKVKRDTLRPFLVYSNEVVTRVLGTSFNIKAYKNEKEVTVAVKTGKVSVYTTAAEQESNNPIRNAVILTPNQKIVYNRDKEQVSRHLVENPEIILPKPTLFRMQYDGAPVTKIFQVLEENYGVDIEFDEEILKGCVLTTSMTDEGLYERIEVICRAINAEYTISDAVIVINGRGCL